MDRSTLVYMAKISEQAERFTEMLEHMKAVSIMPEELSLEERNLLSVASKNVIGARRSSWRVLVSIEQRGESENINLVKEYKAKIEKELADICADILGIIDDHLIPGSNDDEGKVFYYKMKGDYYRYLAECQSGDDKTATSEKALAAYESASDVSGKSLPSTHPIRLGLALNFSVFHYEIMNAPDKACGLAKTAFDEAISELDSLSEESYKDSSLIMQLLRDNLTLWTSEQEDMEASNNA